MTDPIQPSPVIRQLAILNEALEQQKISPSPQVDLKCAKEMQKLLTLVKNIEGPTGSSLDQREFNKVYTCLVGSKESYNQGLTRLRAADVGARFFGMFFERPSESGNAARNELIARGEVFDFTEKVNRWVSEGEEGENRLEAKNEILRCLNTQDSELKLLDLGLKTLPDMFSNKIFVENLKILRVNGNLLKTLPESIGRLSALKSLVACDNQLETLPESIDGLTALTHLIAGRNLLKTLPESIGRLSTLQSLTLDKNKLEALPTSIGNLIALKYLGASNNKLETLPESLSNLIALEKLDLSENKLTTLPENLGNLIALENLDVPYNKLTRLPENLGNLTALKRLVANANTLTRLPESIGRLMALETLSIEHNRTLTGIPNELLNLSRRCYVELSGCGLSQTVLDAIQIAVGAEGYHGPRITHSILEQRRRMEMSLSESLQDLSKITGRALTLKDLPNLPNSNELKIWLGRLCEISDYKTGADKKKGLANNVQDYLQKANEDPEFREVFYSVIQGASETCGDRVALSLMHLGIAHDLSRVDIKDTQKLAKFLIRGIFVMRLLEDVSRTKVASLRFVDEIEVFLGYPVMLKERLKLPINVDQMLYARCSNITSQDLDAAEHFVNEQLSHEEVLCDFLSKQDKWKEALSLKYPEEIRGLEEQKAFQSEGASTTADYEKIEREFARGLVELTKFAVNLKEEL